MPISTITQIVQQEIFGKTRCTSIILADCCRETIPIPSPKYTNISQASNNTPRILNADQCIAYAALSGDCAFSEESNKFAGIFTEKIIEILNNQRNCATKNHRDVISEVRRCVLEFLEPINEV